MVISRIQNFLTFGANANPGEPRVPFYRHAVLVRVTHWLNAGVLLVMLMSGLQIFNAHPALYWGKQSDFAHPFFSLTAIQNSAGAIVQGITQLGPWQFDTTGVLGASRVDGMMTARGFPDWATLPGPQWLAMGRVWHFFFAWLFVINGAIFAVYAFARGHVRDLAPNGRDLRNLRHEIVEHLKLRFPKGEAARRYNVLQKLAYLVVIFVLLPLIILMGIAMSPWLDSMLPGWVDLFGGRQAARTLHFVAAWLLVAFVAIHVFEVIVSGLWNHLRSMITGRYRIHGKEQHELSA